MPKSARAHAPSFSQAFPLIKSYKNIVDLSTNGVIILNNEGKIIFFNDAVRRITGYSKKDLLNKSYTDPKITAIIEPRDFKKLFSPYFKGKRFGHFELNIAHKSGRRIFLDCYLGALKIGRKVVGVQCRFVDISKRTATEKALRDSEQRFKAIFNSTFQFTWLLTPSGSLIEANDTALKFAGIKEKEAVNRPFWKTKWWRGNSERVNKLKAAIRRASKGDRVRYEVELSGANNVIKTFNFFLKPVLGPKGKVAMIIPEAIDINEHKIIVSQLKKERQIAQNYLDIADVIILVLDRGGNIQLINKKGLEILGMKEREVIGRNWFKCFMPKEQMKQRFGSFKKTIINNERFSFNKESSILTSSGEERIISWHNVGLFDDRGHITGTLNSGEDVTEVRRSEKELIDAEKYKTLVSFIAGIVHEIRNPLVAIKAYFEMLHLPRRSEKDNAVMENLAKQELKRIEDHLRYMLNFVRPSDEKYTRSNIEDIIDEAVNMVKFKADKRNINIVADYRCKDCMILMNVRQMEQVFLNLFLNAIDSIEGGGKIFVRSREDRDRKKVIVKINDSGKGIPKESVRKLFEPFYTTKSEGTGLGLSISRHILLRHKGSLHISSKVGKGTTVTVKLPRLL